MSFVVIDRKKLIETKIDLFHQLLMPRTLHPADLELIDILMKDKEIDDYIKMIKKQYDNLKNKRNLYGP